MVLLAEAIYGVRSWNCLRWCDLCTKCKDYRCRQLSKIMVITAKINNSNVRNLDGRDLWYIVLRWLHVERYLYRDSWKVLSDFQAIIKICLEMLIAWLLLLVIQQYFINLLLVSWCEKHFHKFSWTFLHFFQHYEDIPPKSYNDFSLRITDANALRAVSMG